MGFHTPAHKTVNPWREAVIDQLVITHIYSAKHDDNPRDALNDLLAWNQSIALDPLVSYEARQLIEQGKTSAAHATPQPAREPLTGEQIDALIRDQWASNYGQPLYLAARKFARAIEAAHGIKAPA